jgi:acetyl-CoA C-acetyltransferase
MPFTAYIVDCVRTAGGKRNGRLSQIHPADLGAIAVDALVERTGIAPESIDDVIFGCVSQIGAQSANVARNVVLSSKYLPESVPGVTVDRQCGSSQQALHFAAQAVMSGTQDVVIAGGVEVMSLCPIGSSAMDGMAAGRGMPSGDAIQRKYNVMFSQFEGAEMVAQRFDVTRADMEKLAVESHRRAHEATAAGRFKAEIVPVTVTDPRTQQTVVHDADEGIRWPASADKMASLPLLKPDGGRITAATASQITDGSSAVLVCNERALQRLGLKPRAKIVALALAGSDPVMMLAGPIPATHSVLAKAALSINDMDLYEVNEAFASVPLAWAKEVGASLDKLNVNGGAMALGHPLGATGTKLITTLLNELERRNARYGLQAICEGGGTANATIIERVTSYQPLSKL